MICTPLSENDFLKIAKIHKEELRNKGFISNCSVRFIVFYYRRISLYRNSILLVEKNESGIITGFIFCTEDKNKYKKEFYSKIIFYLFIYPEITLPLLKKFFSNKIDFIYYEAELVQIAVNRQYQGKGIGTLLMREAEKEFQNRNIKEYFLQVHKDNDNAVKVYKNSGFEIVDEVTKGKLKKYLMKKRIQIY